jgi:hypothetical protein
LVLGANGGAASSVFYGIDRKAHAGGFGTADRFDGCSSPLITSSRA